MDPYSAAMLGSFISEKQKNTTHHRSSEDRYYQTAADKLRFLALYSSLAHTIGKILKSVDILALFKRRNPVQSS
ncbi:MAG: hypothetical protein ABJN26_24900 [Stappiaceae bacterium]